MINNITNVDTRVPMSINKAATSTIGGMKMPPILSFKTPLHKKKAILRVNKFKRSDDVIIAGVIDDDYVDIVEEVCGYPTRSDSMNFFEQSVPIKQKTRYLKDSYVIDYIQAPQMRCGLGTEAIKGLAEKAMFDPKIQGRIVTFSAPVCKESSPALFFYKLGFRFLDPAGNDYMKECLAKNVPDIPPQTGMMYLPKHNLQKLLRYGDLF